MKKAICIAATAALLSACGGGGNSGGGAGLLAGAPAPAPTPAPAPAPAPPPTPAPAPAPASRTVTYEALPLATDLSSQLNAQGANGWRYIGAIGFTISPTEFETRNLYVKDANTTYSYEIVSNATSSAALLAQLNAEGARGFKYGGPDAAGAIYRKDNTSSSTYIYRVVAAPSSGAETSAELIAQTKAQGAEGYYHLGGSLLVGGSTVRLYQKDSQGTATYDIEALALPATEADFLAQLAAEGARGFRFKTGYAFGTEGILNLYEKDSSQAATFGYRALAPQPDSAAFVAQANAQGSNGTALIGDYGLPGGAIKTLFFTPSNCSGMLCDARAIFGF